MGANTVEPRALVNIPVGEADEDRPIDTSLSATVPGLADLIDRRLGDSVAPTDARSVLSSLPNWVMFANATGAVDDLERSGRITRDQARVLRLEIDGQIARHQTPAENVRSSRSAAEDAVRPTTSDANRGLEIFLNILLGLITAGGAWLALAIGEPLLDLDERPVKDPIDPKAAGRELAHRPQFVRFATENGPSLMRLCRDADDSVPGWETQLSQTQTFRMVRAALVQAGVPENAADAKARDVLVAASREYVRTASR